MPCSALGFQLLDDFQRLHTRMLPLTMQINDLLFASGGRIVGLNRALYPPFISTATLDSRRFERLTISRQMSACCPRGTTAYHSLAWEVTRKDRVTAVNNTGVRRPRSSLTD